MMIGRDTLNEHASVFAMKEQSVMVEKGTCKHSESTGTITATATSLLVIEPTGAAMGVAEVVEAVEAEEPRVEVVKQVESLCILL